MEELFEQIEQSNRALHKLQRRYRFAMLHELGIHPGQFPILDVIHRNPGCTQNEVAREHCASSASIGVSVKRLEQAGLIRRSADQRDQRANRLELTEKGEQVAAQAMKEAKQLAQLQMRGFTPEEMRLYVSFLRRMRRNLESYVYRTKWEDED